MAELRTSVLALRAISALLLQRFLRPVMVMVIILTVAAYVLTVLLALSFSAWWWLLLIVLIPSTLLLFAAGYILWFLLQQLLPRKLTRSERGQLDRFVTNLTDVAERSRTPYPIVLFLVAKDVLRGRESAFVGGLIGDSKTIMREFGKLEHLFRDEEVTI